MRPIQGDGSWAGVCTRSTSIRGVLGPLLGALFLGSATAGAQTTPLPSPDEHFGYQMGADRKLVHYDEAVPYYELLDRGSDRVEIHPLEATTLGRDMIYLMISTPENLARAETYREISAKLDDPRGLSDEAIDALVEQGKVVLLITLNIHSSEIASSQMGLEWVHRLATTDVNSDLYGYLKEVIVLLVPSMNPDGQAMITEWYRKYVGTRFEGGAMPWLYHPYAGHDNNRDWFMLNLRETQAINRLAYHDWFPQVLVDEHQMGATGPRAFVPPYSDPVSDKVHPLIHRAAMLFGANMAMDLERAGKSGVIYSYSFDAYWPGGTRSTPWWKNTVGILTEIASARVASPIYVDPGELSGGRKGLPDYKPQINFPNPWPGGWWRPRDIVEYELIITESALKTCALHRRDLLWNRAAMGRDAVRLGDTEAPYGYVIPPTQHDPGTAAKLIELLIENGLEIFRAPSRTVAGGQVIPAGSYVTLAAQPYRSFLVEMMEPQVYPEVRVGPSSEEIYHPYDVTSWSLPYLMGVESYRLEAPSAWPLERVEGPVWDEPTLIEGQGTVWALSPRMNDSYTAVWRLLEAEQRVIQVRTPFQAGGVNWPAGTFLTEAPPEKMEGAVFGLCTRARRIEKPEGLDEAVANPLEGEGVFIRRHHILNKPRVGIYQSWLASMDEGWTRFVLDSFEIPYRILHDKDIQAGNLNRTIDVILFPDLDRSRIVDGKPASRRRYVEPRPKPYDGGLDEKGVEALDRFVRKGGMLVTLGNAAELAIQDLNIPVQNVVEKLPPKEFSTPGAMLRVVVDTQDPLGYGMPEHALVYHTSDPVLGTRLPGPGTERRVIARYVDGEGILASGFAVGTKHLDRKAALVEASLGEGSVVLFAFRPQHRGHTHATYRMLFNALLKAGAR